MVPRLRSVCRDLCAPRTLLLWALRGISVSVLTGCVSAYVYEQQDEELVRLNKIVVAAAEEAPDIADLNDAPAPLRTVEVADLTFRVHALHADRIKDLHSAAGGDADVAAGDVVMILLAEALLYPIIPLDLATAAVLTAAHESGKLSDRVIVLAYDATGAYRWHLCCPTESAASESGFPRNLMPNPDSDAFSDARHDRATRRRTSLRFGEDYWALVCDLATQGEPAAQFRLSGKHAGNGTIEDAVARYYWLKTRERAKPDDKQIKLDIYSVELDLSPETLAEARRQVDEVAPGDVDCREAAALLNRSRRYSEAGS